MSNDVAMHRESDCGNEYAEPLIRVQDLKKYYPVSARGLSFRKEQVHALEELNFEIYEGKTLGLVGESGCGKSTLGRQLVAMERPTQGSVIFRSSKGELDIASMSERALRPHRNELQMIFQDNGAALNPRKHIYEILAAPLLRGQKLSRDEAHKRVDELLDMVGLPANSKARYPHEFSGGQRQRIGIARALSLNPRFIVCDEPVSALDASIQAQVLNLLARLQRDLGLTYLFIGHGLAAVQYISDRIAVMYLGRIVELAPAREIFDHPLHPYTKALVKAAPRPDPQRRAFRERPIQGELPSNIKPPSGCPFHPRCPRAQASCSMERPELLSMDGRSCPDSHYLACPPVAKEERGGVSHV